MLTEKSLREDSSQIKSFTGLPPEVFWELVNKAQAKVADYERERLDRPDRQRAVGGGRNFDQPFVITYCPGIDLPAIAYSARDCGMPVWWDTVRYIKGLAEATAAASPGTSSAGNMGKGERGRSVGRGPGFRAGAVG